MLELDILFFNELDTKYIYIYIYIYTHVESAYDLRNAFLRESCVFVLFETFVFSQMQEFKMDYAYVMGKQNYSSMCSIRAIK